MREDMRDRWEVTQDAPGREALWLKINALNAVQGLIEAIARGEL